MGSIHIWEDFFSTWFSSCQSLSEHEGRNPKPFQYSRSVLKPAAAGLPSHLPRKARSCRPSTTRCCHLVGMPPWRECHPLGMPPSGNVNLWECHLGGNATPRECHRLGMSPSGNVNLWECHLGGNGTPNYRCPPAPCTHSRPMTYHSCLHNSGPLENSSSVSWETKNSGVSADWAGRHCYNCWTTAEHRCYKI